MWKKFFRFKLKKTIYTIEVYIMKLTIKKLQLLILETYNKEQKRYSIVSNFVEKNDWEQLKDKKIIT